MTDLDDLLFDPHPGEPMQWERSGWTVTRPLHVRPIGIGDPKDLVRVSDGQIWFYLARDLYDALDDTAFVAVAAAHKRAILARPSDPTVHVPGALATPQPACRFARKDITDEQVVAACSHGHGADSLAYLMEETGAPRKVCLAAMHRANARQLINYGVCIERAWADR